MIEVLYIKLLIKCSGQNIINKHLYIIKKLTLHFTLLFSQIECTNKMEKLSSVGRNQQYTHNPLEYL